VSLPPGARDVRAVGGGYVNEAFRIVLADGAALRRLTSDARPRPESGSHCGRFVPAGR
jgi:hypothetical protein